MITEAILMLAAGNTSQIMRQKLQAYLVPSTSNAQVPGGKDSPAAAGKAPSAKAPPTKAAPARPATVAAGKAPAGPAAAVKAPPPKPPSTPTPTPQAT
jgi:hypothetical protein